MSTSQTRTLSRRRGARVIAVMLAFLLLAAACGGETEPMDPVEAEERLQELVDDIKRRGDDKVKMSGTARGGAWDLARAGLLLAADIPVGATIWVPTEGAAPSLVELLGGHIDRNKHVRCIVVQVQIACFGGFQFGGSLQYTLLQNLVCL